MMLSIWLAVRLFVCCCCLKLSRQQWCYISCFPALWQTSPSPSCEIYAYGGGLLMASVNALHLLSNLYKWFFDLKMARFGYICRGEVNLCTKVELLRLAVLGLAPDTGQSMMAMVDVDVSSPQGSHSHNHRSVDLVWGSAAARHCSALSRVNFSNAVSKHCRPISTARPADGKHRSATYLVRRGIIT